MNNHPNDITKTASEERQRILADAQALRARAHRLSSTLVVDIQELRMTWNKASVLSEIDTAIDYAQMLTDQLTNARVTLNMATKVVVALEAEEALQNARVMMSEHAEALALALDPYRHFYNCRCGWSGYTLLYVGITFHQLTPTLPHSQGVCPGCGRTFDGCMMRPVEEIPSVLPAPHEG